MNTYIVLALIVILISFVANSWLAYSYRKSFKDSRYYSKVSMGFLISLAILQIPLALLVVFNQHVILFIGKML